ARRYASALELADDLRRYQAGEPIHARPVGLVEQTWRWCRRRPVVASLLALSAALALALVASLLVINAQLQRARTQADQLAEERRQGLVRLCVSSGMIDAQEGNSFMALLWFTEALRLDAVGPGGSQQRIRIATTLAQCPALLQLLAPGRRVLCTRLN